MSVCVAPWAREVITSLNDYQYADELPSYICPEDSRLLIATLIGWVCPDCGYGQSWALTFTADGSWRHLSWVA